MKTPTLTSAVVILACFGLSATFASAAKPAQKSFGKGSPFQVEDLPNGKLKSQLRALNPKARAKAKAWLDTMQFGEFDAAEHLRVDNDGGVFIVCPGDHVHPQDEPATGDGAPSRADGIGPSGVKAAPQAPSEPVVAAAAVPVSNPPAYNSKPDAPYHIYLDFNGAIVAGKAWNTSKGVASWDCAAWGTDSDPTTFSDSEQAEIRRFWERTSEDYAAFNINVTTDVAYDVDNYTGDKNKVGWLLFTATTDKNGIACPHNGYGGIAYVGVFGNSNYFSNYQPAWVAPYSAANGTEAGTHEMGHNLGLSHDATSTLGYYGGHAATSTAPSWGPIMGTGYGRNVTQWSKGEYLDANQFQDDLAIISARTPYRTDDFGNTFAAASVLTGTSISQKGNVERTNDTDYFKFTTGAGTITFNAAAYKCDTSTWGGNLDIQLELYDSTQTLVATSNPAADINASISMSVAAGDYYLVIRPSATGTPLASPPSGYTIYGSLGQYTITGTINSAFAPEIAVEQPLGTGLTDGSSTINLGSVPSGSPGSPISVTISNTGTANLTGLALSKSGTNSADYTLGSLGTTSLAPGASTTFAVTFSPSAVGTRTAAIQIASNDADENPFDINLTGTGTGPGTLVVTPAGGLTASGPYGGSFSPSSLQFSLSNPGSTSINWTAAKSQSWVTLSATGGTLAAGANTTVTASINSGASTFNIGNYSDTVTFTNTTNGGGNSTRAVALTVNTATATVTLGNLNPTYDGSPKSASVATTPAGLASSVTYNGSPTSPTNAGTYAVVATVTQPNYAGSASGNLVIAKAAQTIGFGALPDVQDDSAPFALTATATSGLGVSYTSSNPAVATVSGTTVTIAGLGTTTITASQVGNTNYSAAASVPQTLTVVRANPLAVITGAPYKVLVGQTLVLDGSASQASYGATVSTYEWDLNNDDNFGDATGATPPAISFATLTDTWGMVQGLNTVQLKITDSANKTSIVSTTVELVLALAWDANGVTAGQTNGGGAWLGANLWWDGAANQSWASGSNATFGGPGTAGGAVTLAAATSVNAITFNAFTGTYTLGTAGQTLTINGGINKTVTSAAVKISSPITLGAGQAWTNNSSGALTLSSSLDNGGNLLTVDGSGIATMKAGTISGSGGLTKNGTGFLEIGGQYSAVAHTYTGPTTINGGAMRVNGDNVTYGNLGGGNLTLDGGILEYYYGGTFVRTLGSGSGQVQILGGASGFGSGNGATFTLNNSTAFEAVWGSSFFNPSTLVFNAATSAGSTTLANKLDLNGATRTIQVVAGTGTVSGIIRTSSGTAGLVKTGNGNLILSAANTFSGEITVSGGSLQIGNNTAGTLGSGTYNGNISVSSGASLRIFSTASQTLGGTISGSGSLVKAYGGTLTLSNSNTYTGKTSLTPQTTAGTGILSVSSFNSVNGGTPLFASSSLGAPTTLANGTIDFGSTASQAAATLRYTGSGETTDRPVNFLFNGTGATKTLEASGTGLLKFISPFTGSGSDSNDITLQGTGNGEISGGLPFTFRNLAKSGTGTWTLGGSVGNIGTTTITAGSLALDANDVLSDVSPVSIATATLDAAAFSDTLGTLDVTAAAVVNLGSGAALAFADSSAVDWTGGSLNITGTFVSGVSLRFGTSNTGLTSVQLAKLFGDGLSAFALNSNGYLTASGGSGDTTPPTLAGISDDKGGNPVLVNTVVSYTVTFSEAINAATVDSSDFGNAGNAAGLIGSVTQTAPGVFNVPVTPTSAGSLRFRINAGAVITDLAGNPLDTTSELVHATVITVTPVNSAPVAQSQSVTTAEDTSKAITVVGTDADGDPLTYTIISQPANGTLSGTAPNVTYTPAADYNGSDSFSFRVNDGTLNSAPASVSITVIPVNDAPVAIAQSVATVEDTAKAITLIGTDVDGDPLTYTIISQPANGTLSGTAPNVTYTPAADYNGSDSFSFRVNDGTLNSAPASVSITVIPVNDAPVAIAQSVATAEDTAKAITLIGTDVDGDPLIYSIVSQPANGTLSGTAPNVTYTPAADYNGSDSFSFRVNDGTANSTPATVSISITPVNDVPVFNTNPIIAAGGEEGIPYTGQTLAGTATDPDAGDILSYSKVSGPAWLSVASGGAMYGTPGSGTTGLNSFVVRVTDSSGATVDATLQISVAGLPLPWVSTDIGTGMLTGSATFSAGTLTQSGSGLIGSTADKFRFTYQTLSGDGEIIAKISALQNTGTGSRVGVMIRDSLAANSKEILMGMASTGIYRWDRRITTGGATTSSINGGGTIPNTWVRLVRSGSTITAYKSTNGTTWLTVGSTTGTTFASTCYIGLAVSSGSSTTLNTSQFSNLTVTP